MCELDAKIALSEHRRVSASLAPVDSGRPVTLLSLRSGGVQGLYMNLDYADYPELCVGSGWLMIGLCYVRPEVLPRHAVSYLAMLPPCLALPAVLPCLVLFCPIIFFLVEAHPRTV